MKQLSILSTILIVMLSCQSIPKGAKPVESFQSENYLGKWYEICRMDFRFERNLNQTTAEYTLIDDKTIRVRNRGFHTEKQEWKEVVGKAKFVQNPNVAQLKVSFFGPFYAPYNVIAIDKEYKYALVAGKNTKYMWILSREKTIPDNIKNDYVSKAKALGFKTEELVWVTHD